jgi:hypothetical protein
MSFLRLSIVPRSFAFTLLLLALTGPALESAAQPGYPARIHAARSIWRKDSNRIAELLEKLREHATTGNKLDKDIAKSQDEIGEVEEKLAEQLREMAEGRFCSECLRNATEIERGGEGFLYHLRSVRGVMVPASPEQFAQARQRAADKIASIRKKMSEQQADKTKARDALSDALHQLNVTIAAYHQHITAEKDLQIAAWAEEAGKWQKALEEQRAQLDALAKAPETTARDTQIRAVDAQVRSSLASTSAAEARARQTATSFNQTVRKDMDYLARKAEGIPAGQPLVDGWFIGKSITSQNITYVAGLVRRPQSTNAAQLLKAGPAATTSSPAGAEKSVSDLLKGK